MKEKASRYSSFYINMYVFQNQPLGAVNTDEAGAPKEAYIGGIRRLRASSQAIKKAIRTYLKTHFGEDSVRIKKTTEHLARRLSEATGATWEDALKYTASFMKYTSLVSTKKDSTEKKETCMFFNERQLENMVRKMTEMFNDGKYPDNTAKKKPTKEDDAEIIDCINKDPSICQLFFGRMFATNPDYDYEACCDVAHAFSVNRYTPVFDLFSANTDKEYDPSRGSSFLDTRILGSGIMYKYAAMDLSDGTSLVGQEGIDEAIAAAQFVEAFAKASLPGGQHSSGAATLPYRVVVDIRRDCKTNCAPAFETPVEGEDLPAATGKAFDDYRKELFRMYGAPEAVFDTAKDMSLAEICNAVEDSVRNR